MMENYHYWLILSAVYATPQLGSTVGWVLSVVALVIGVVVGLINE